MNPVGDYSSDFHSKRVDLYLGQFLRNFAAQINDLKTFDEFLGGFECKCIASSVKDINKSLIAGLIISYFLKEDNYCNFTNESECVNTSTKILNQFQETFVDLVHHSVLKNSLSKVENKVKFLNIYEESIRSAFNAKNIEVPVHLSQQIEMISFCSQTVKTKEELNEKGKAINCDIFKAILTSKGPCFAYNALSMQQLYKETAKLVNWNKVFGHEFITISQNDGYGPAKGLMFVLNSFDKYLESSNSLNFELAISNAYEPHIMMKKKHAIKPGFLYTFRVLAKQTVASIALNNMRPKDRNCFLANENRYLNFSRFYTKSTCEYECTIYKAVEECGCAPWYIPFFEDMPYCSVQTHCGFYSDWNPHTICNVQENCFQNYLNNASNDQCQCPTDCQEIDYSIIKSNQQLLLPQNFCTNEILKTQYPFSVYCEMCHKIIQYHKIRLVYDHYRSNKPHPDDINAFCHYFISNYTALVKIEMVSKSVMRSVRDKRFSLMSQVSQLGKN